MTMISVSLEALQELLDALTGPSYLVRELQAVAAIDPDSPIPVLIRQVNEALERMKITASTEA